MAQHITPTKVVTITQNGECHLIITLELNINLTGAGGVSASVQTAERANVDEDNIQFTIPDFSKTSGKIVNFGKEER